MKKAWAYLLLVVMLVTLLAGCGAAPEFDTEVNVMVDMDSKIGEISPNIYGQFIEHIETCIYNGIWSEMVLDRKFYYEVGNAGFSPWKASDENLVVSQQEHVYSDNGYAPTISSGGAIYQKEMTTEKDKQYEGYFYASVEGDQSATVTISLEYQGKTASVKVDVSGSEWKKYTYELAAPASSKKMKYQMAVDGAKVTLDSISMMPADNYYGMRIDTLELLKELDSPIYRWPGGNFLSGYDWKDGVGDIDKRPSRRNLHYMGTEDSFVSDSARETSDLINLEYLGFYGGIEPNDFGLDEFMKMCEYLQTDVLMMVNNGLGSLEDAADQVEYCNGGTDTTYGALRAENGHATPYGIHYWGVGNEMFGSWQLGRIPIGEYVIRHNEFSKEMLERDPSIELIGVGLNTNNWTEEMFKNCAGNLDYIAEHIYAKRDETDLYNHLMNVKSNISGRIENHRKLLERIEGVEDVTVAFTEYAYANVICQSRLKDGLGIGVYLNEMINNADVVKMAFYSSTVNATQGCITTTDTDAMMQGSGYVLKFYRKYMESIAVTSSIQKSLPGSVLDMSAAVSEDGKTITLAFVNSSDQNLKINCEQLKKWDVKERHSVVGDYLESFNSAEKSEIYEQHAENEKYIYVPQYSLTIIVLQK